jgi:hypothetical protein
MSARFPDMLYVHHEKREGRLYHSRKMVNNSTTLTVV